MPAQEEWDTDSVFVSNKTHDKYTELLIKGEPEKPGVKVCGWKCGTVWKCVVGLKESGASVGFGLWQRGLWQGDRQQVVSGVGNVVRRCGQGYVRRAGDETAPCLPCFAAISGHRPSCLYPHTFVLTYVHTFCPHSRFPAGDRHRHGSVWCRGAPGRHPRCGQGEVWEVWGQVGGVDMQQVY